ncbi:MAG: hypothetical protein ACO1QR_00250 [Chthoniobacteraceae bacterium]
MRAILLFLIFSISGFATSVQSADPWKEQPIFKAVWLSAATTTGEYEHWAGEWKKQKRSRTSCDQSINLMAETNFIAIQMALNAHPNPQLLEQCLVFLGTIVPQEFDDLWRARILEMADIDKVVTMKVDELLKSKKLPGLEERAMGRR